MFFNLNTTVWADLKKCTLSKNLNFLEDYPWWHLCHFESSWTWIFMNRCVWQVSLFLSALIVPTLKKKKKTPDSAFIVPSWFSSCKSGLISIITLTKHWSLANFTLFTGKQTKADSSGEVEYILSCTSNQHALIFFMARK